MQNVPFTITDALGYVAAGLIVMVAATIAVVGELPTQVSIVTGIGVGVAAYVVGHCLSGPAITDQYVFGSSQAPGVVEQHPVERPGRDFFIGAVILLLAPGSSYLELEPARGGPVILSANLLALLAALAAVLLFYRYVNMFLLWRREIFRLYAETSVEH